MSEKNMKQFKYDDITGLQTLISDEFGGWSNELEVSQKRSALENVLIPETLASHELRLRSAGFENFCVWFQCFNFMSLVAIK